MELTDDTRLRQFLTSITEKIGEVIRQLKRKQGIPLKSDLPNAKTGTDSSLITTNTNSKDLLLDNSVQNNNVNTFTIDNDENELLDRLTNDIQNILTDCSAQLSIKCSGYIQQHLHQYNFDSDKEIFTQRLTTNVLHSFKYGLNGLLLAAKIYPAVLNGDTRTLDSFLKHYPMYKNKPGFEGTTLLYSATRNNNFPLVGSLIEKYGCDVNARNQSDVTSVLIGDNDTTRANIDQRPYNTDITLAATALHAACSNNNLEIVKYLISKGANYFLKNQLGETPIQNGKTYPAIQKFFNDYLVSAYVSVSTASLPTAPILDCHDRKAQNCVWEYKPVKGFEWKQLTVSEHNALCAALIEIDNNESFNTSTDLNAQQGTCVVNLVTFLQNGKSQKPSASNQDTLAWIRCRGSSIASFGIYCVWQLMFVKYDDKEQFDVDTPSLDAKTFPSAYDSRFHIKINSWYTCDSKRNALLDDAINYRRRYIDIDCNFDTNHIGNRIVKCNLYEFTFTNNNKTILGFIRWIPKFIMNTANDQSSLKVLDNFNIINNFTPIPLTTNRLEQLTRPRSANGSSLITSEKDEHNVIEFTNDSLIDDTELDDDDDHDTYSSTTTLDSNTWNLNEHQSKYSQSTHQHDDPTWMLIEPNLVSHVQMTNIDDFNEKDTDLRISEPDNIGIIEARKRNNHPIYNGAQQKAEAALKIENEQMHVKAIPLQSQVCKRLKYLKEQDTTSSIMWNTTTDKLEHLEKSLRAKNEQENLVKQMAEKISTIEYQISRSNQILILKSDSILHTLRKMNYYLKEYFQDTVPIIELDNQNSDKMILKGLPIHHQELKEIFDRLQNLMQQIQSAEAYYNQKTSNNIQSLLRTIQQIRSANMVYWKSYCKSLVKSVIKKHNDYVEKFKIYINEKLRILVDSCIQNSKREFEKDIIDATNDYMNMETFLTDVEILKTTALNEFIHDHILLEQKVTKFMPIQESVFALNKHIEKIKNIMKTDMDYNGCEFQHFQMISFLLERLMIFYHCFLSQLPLYKESFDLLCKIERNTIITIETATGSGKSTLLPALLVAEGYDKIIATQPRRLQCNLLSQRVNSMVSDNISGWAVSGAEKNVQGKILYLTDGLLKERLLNDEYFLTESTKVSKSVIFFIDEVHERSINTDLCLALFARLLQSNPKLKTKMKLLITSATLDVSVSALYTNISGCSLIRLNLESLSTRYPVTIKCVPNENLLDLVQNLYRRRNRYDQILCFVSSTQDACKNCELLKKITKGNIIAYPLIQSQSAIDQQKYIEHGSVFFSSTVAETSLTFPSLKYVIDTGVINIPVYNLALGEIELQEIKSAESTTKQRLGRLGRTQSGEYYALYDYTVGQQRKYPMPQICQSELANLEFTLRKSLLRTNLKEFLKYLPDKPRQEYIDDAVEQLQRLELIDTSSNECFTTLGASVAELPSFGSLPMSKAVYAALDRYQCGRDLIVLSSILSVLNTSSILKGLPVEYKRPEGDFMTLLQVMNTMLSVRDAVPHKQFNVDRICNAKRLSDVVNVIKLALRRYKSLETAFSLSDKFRESAQIQSGSWENIAKALLSGFSDKVYVSQKLLHGKTQEFVRYNFSKRIKNSEQYDSLNKAAAGAVIDRSSTLKTGNIEAVVPSVVVARDIHYLTATRSTAILSFVGQLESSWLEYQFLRKIRLTPTEEDSLKNNHLLKQIFQLFPQVKAQVDDCELLLYGPSGYMLKAELYIRQQLVTTLKFTLESNEPNNPNSNLTRNLKTITSMASDIFGPLRWRWESENQVKVRTEMQRENGTIEVTVEGFDSQNRAVRNEFMSFLSWLRMCAVIQDPDSGVTPQVLKPQTCDQFLNVEAKICNITDSNRTLADIWRSLKGPKATRETRMEVVAWIAVCQFYCRLEGGFVRDWIVGNYSSRPANLPPNQWVQKQSSGIPLLHRDVVPADLDCVLPQAKIFDIKAFWDALYSHGITAAVWRQDWRYVLLIDENTKTGPFTMDLIEPHIALTHDRIDFDVNNLSLRRGYTKDLGMRVDITKGAYQIQLETIVENIRNKNFQVLRPIDGENGPNTKGSVAERIEKMKSRGWTHIDTPFLFIPDPPLPYNAILVPYPSTTILYQNLVTAIHKISGSNVISIEQIKNPAIEALYESMKRKIAKECHNNDPNEQNLFYGTSGEAIQRIINKGFGDEYFSPNKSWGRGIYFADDPRRSNNYTLPDTNTGQRVIFYSKVLLGVKSIQPQVNSSLSAAPQNHHSVHGTAFEYHEYIVYRYDQALPYLKITYKASK